MNQERPFVALEHLEGWTGKLRDEVELVAVAPAQSGMAEAEPGDVLFGKLRPYLAKSWLVDQPVLASTELLCLRPRTGLESRFLGYLMTSAPIVEWASATSHGTRMPRTSWESLGEYRPWIPSLAEQRAIADYLDTETTRIDTLITKKRCLIELLTEHRTALITQTVTKGLPPPPPKPPTYPPNPPLKPTNIPWLGDIPEHWAVRPFRRVFRESLKYGANEAADLEDPNLPRYIRITDIDDNGNLRDGTFRSLPVAVAAPYLLQAGDLLFARSGSVGRTFLYDESWGPCAYAGYLIRARIEPALAIPKFIAYFTASQSYASWLRTEAIQSTIENVNAERYSRMPVPLPPVAEQKAITDHLDTETARIDTLTSLAETAIERLQEYRTALITAAVTGEVKVSTR